jgi:hypothetical protein
MKAYMVFADAPPAGCDADDELLVSLTYRDVIEEYDEFYWNGDKPYWANLPASTQHSIFEAVGESGIALADIFDHLVP